MVEEKDIQCLGLYLLAKRGCWGSCIMAHLEPNCKLLHIFNLILRQAIKPFLKKISLFAKTQARPSHRMRYHHHHQDNWANDTATNSKIAGTIIIHYHSSLSNKTPFLDIKDKIFRFGGKYGTKSHLGYKTPHRGPSTTKDLSVLYCPSLTKNSECLHIYHYSSMTNVSSHKGLVWFAQPLREQRKATQATQ